LYVNGPTTLSTAGHSFGIVSGRGKQIAQSNIMNTTPEAIEAFLVRAVRPTAQAGAPARHPDHLK
jgi:hypothetical protein